MTILMVPMWAWIGIGLAIALHGMLILWLRGKPTTPNLSVMFLWGMLYAPIGWRAGNFVSRHIGRSVYAIVDGDLLMEMPAWLSWTVRFLPIAGGLAATYAIVLALVFQRWTAPFIAAVSAPLFAVGAALIYTYAGVSMYRMETVNAVGYHALAMALLLAWALPALPVRLRQLRARQLSVEDLKFCCRKCGYDLRGAVADVCPECGGKIGSKLRRRLTAANSCPTIPGCEDDSKCPPTTSS